MDLEDIERVRADLRFRGKCFLKIPNNLMYCCQKY